MPLFASNQFDQKVDKATSESHHAENWQAIMELCDEISRGDAAAARDAVKAMARRLQDRNNAWVQSQTLTLLGACVQNSGREFCLAVCTRDFCALLKKMALSKALQPKIQVKLKSLLLDWQRQFSNDAQLDLVRGLVKELKDEGVDFSDASETPLDSKTTPTTNFASTPSQPSAAALAAAEEEELAAAIRESLKLSQGQTSSTLYPAISPPMVKKKRRVKVMYAFEAKEDNELSLQQGQFISVVDDSDANWWSGENERGNKGYFPASFVTSDLSYEPPPEEPPQEEEEEPQVVLDEPLIDHLLKLLQNAKPGDDPHSAEQQEIKRVEAAVKAMIPLIEDELAENEREHLRVSAIDKKYSEALSLYERMVKFAPPPQQAAPHYGHMPQHGGWHGQHAPPSGYGNAPSYPPQGHAPPAMYGQPHPSGASAPGYPQQQYSYDHQPAPQW